MAFSRDLDLLVDACDREPIHTPGYIQAHGHLVVADARSGRILKIAGDDSLLNGPMSAALGRQLASIIGKAGAQLAQKAPPGNGEPVYLGRIRPSMTSIECDMFVHRHAGQLLVELEQRPAKELDHNLLLARTGTIAARISGEETLIGACQAAAEEVRSLLGYDRVMIYRFLEGGTGAVVAEDLKAGTRPFLNHRFPASDIPAQARRLYVDNLVRVIPDTEYRPAPLLAMGSAEAEPPLDMSGCVLRGISPIHIQYLKNMGVSASASISIVRNGELWGLIACHHFSPRQVSWELRETCKHLAQFLSERIRGDEEAERHSRALALTAVSQELLDALRGQLDVDGALAAQICSLSALFQCSGAAVVVGETISAYGLAPASESVVALSRWLLSSGSERCFATHTLHSAFPPAEGFGVRLGGLMSLVIDADLPVVLLWFRAEELQIIEWAGSPHKAAPASSSVPLSPRQSFDTWREEVRGSSAPWAEADRRGAEAFAASLLHIRVSAQLARLNRQLGTALENERAALEEIRLLQANLMQVGRRSAMATMASTLAHEVNQPLLALSNYVGAARHLVAKLGSNDLSPVGAALDAAGESIKKVADIVRNMRRSLDAQQITLVETDFSRTVEQALALALSNEPASGIQHDLNLQEGLLVEADTVQIQQVVLNLVANAVDAMAETRGRRLSISTFLLEGEACLRVSDSGSGLSEEARTRLFEAFYTTKPGRLGTGLAVCRTIIEAHGGRIWTEYEVEGSTFLISLPLVRRTQFMESVLPATVHPL